MLMMIGDKMTKANGTNRPESNAMAQTNSVTLTKVIR